MLGERLPRSRSRRIVQTGACSASSCESPRVETFGGRSPGGSSAGAVWALPCRCRRLSGLLRCARCCASVDALAFAALASAAALSPTPRVGHEIADRVCGHWLRVTRVRSASKADSAGDLETRSPGPSNRERRARWPIERGRRSAMSSITRAQSRCTSAGRRSRSCSQASGSGTGTGSAEQDSQPRQGEVAHEGDPGNEPAPGERAQ